MTNPAYRVVVNDGQTTRITLIFTSSTTWTVPLDWNSGYNFIEGIGGGGSGNYQGAGGGGGAYTNTGNIVLSPGTSVPIVIGAAGTNGGNGGNTTFNTSTLVAQGGGGGLTLNGLGGQASLCIPSNTAQSGGNGGVGTNQFSSITYGGGAGGGGGGAAGPNYTGRPGGSGNMFVGGGGGGGAGGSGSLGGFPGTFSSGSRIGGAGGTGPLTIGSGNGSATTGSAGTTGGGGGAGGIGNIAVSYNAGAGGASASNGSSTLVSVLGITVVAFGGSSNIGGTASSTVSGSIRQANGGGGGPAGTVGFIYNCGGGGGINLGTSTSQTGGQSVDFQSLRSIVENLGYSWTAPGTGNYPNAGTNATGFGCGGGGGYYYNTGFGQKFGSAGGNGLFGGGGGGAAYYTPSNTLWPGGTGGNGVVIVQTITSTSTANLLLAGSGVYIPPIDVVHLKIWAIGGGAGGFSGPVQTPGGGAGGIAYMEITGGYQGGSGGNGGNGTVSANGWSNNTAFVGPGGGGGGAMLSRAVTDSAVPAQGTAGSGGFYGGGSGGGGGSYVAGAPGLLAITYQPFVQSSTTIDVDDLLVLKSSVIPSNLSSVGYNLYGQLGLGNPPAQLSSPQQIGTNTQWANFSAGYINSGAITGAGNLFVWGSNSQGQLGLNVLVSTVISTPVQLVTSTWKQLAWGGGADACFILALATNGNIWASGNNSNACLGDGTAGVGFSKSSLVQVAVNRNSWKSVTAGYFYALALANDNTLWGWGNRSLAWSSATASASTPVQLGSDTWESISGGHNFAMALVADGSLYGWGTNNLGQLGLNDITTRTSPARVGAIGGWRAVACGKDHTLAIANNGTLWSWGNNFLGQLGINVSGGSRSSPVQIGTLTTWQSVSANESASLAVRSDGTLWTWGNNVYGGLGLGDIFNRSSPTQVGTNINWKTASMGQLHMLAAAYPNMALPPS
jgi:alpha-tubulin suppressor-like RCC1 family protein